MLINAFWLICHGYLLKRTFKQHFKLIINSSLIILIIYNYLMKKVLFYQKGTPKKQIELWDTKLKKWYQDFKLVNIDDPEASEAIIALLWKAPMKKISKFKKIEAIISLGQGVDHIINDINFNKNISVYRIVDPYMAKSMSHWVILSILNFVRDYEGYRKQQIHKIYKSRNCLDFKNIKIGIYGIGEIGKVVAKDLNSLGFNVLGWSRLKKNFKFIKSYYSKNGFNYMIENCDIHLCLLPLTGDTKRIFNKDIFLKMKEGVCFINAGRGEHIVEKDLISFCGSKIKLAVLDVFGIEPLPKKHPFWENKNILIWPHVSAETNIETASKQVAEAIKLIHSGKIPENKINLNLGY